VVVTVAAYGTKSPRFFIFKGQPGKFFVQYLVKDNAAGRCQLNGWFDESMSNKLIQIIIKPYTRGAEDG
jgi:hypothetical protein